MLPTCRVPSTAFCNKTVAPATLLAQPAAVQTTTLLMVKPALLSEEPPPLAKIVAVDWMSPVTCRLASPVGTMPIPSLVTIVVSRFSVSLASLTLSKLSSVVSCCKLKPSSPAGDWRISPVIAKMPDARLISTTKARVTAKGLFLNQLASSGLFGAAVVVSREFMGVIGAFSRVGASYDVVSKRAGAAAGRLSRGDNVWTGTVLGAGACSGAVWASAGTAGGFCQEFCNCSHLSGAGG